MSVDAPGWAEHISVTNAVLCLSNLQPFNQSSLSSALTHLDCCSHCGKEEALRELCLKDYPSLESIHIGSYSFPHIMSVEVSHLPQLKQFVVENHCFMHPITINLGMACRVEDCPLLESISMSVGSFYEYSGFSLKGGELGGEVMVRFASSEVAVCGR